MKQKDKIRVAVLCGGQSGEHEVSLQSAASVMRNLDTRLFDVIPIGIDKMGQWHHLGTREELLNQMDQIKSKALTLSVDTPVTGLPVRQNNNPVIGSQTIDVVFPVIHGTNGEDGALQGLLELANIPYVGCGVLASAIGMDKEIAKRLIRDAGLKMVPYLAYKKSQWQGSLNSSQQEIEKQISEQLGYPCFVKPASCGSSVGVHKVKNASQLKAALNDAFLYDMKVLVEKSIEKAREIEFAVLENPIYGESPLVSVAGEIIPQHEFYSYEAKYLDENGASVKLPADLTSDQMKAFQKIAAQVFEVLECEGMSRVDFLMDRVTGELYFNEVNTIPGFTSISMYPKMWEASGISYSELLTKLVNLALSRHERRSSLVRDYLK